MGQLFGGGLTNPNSALMSPQGQPTFMGSPSQVMSRANQQIPSPTAMMGTDPLNPQDTGAGQNLPRVGTPSFLQAANIGPGGTPDAMSPGLSKAGKLATLLMGGLKGAIAGRAAQEQMSAATGGRRAGGFGTGFQAGMSEPYQELEQRQQAQLGQAGLQPIPLPGGVTVPAAMAPKFLSPYLGYQGKIGAAQIGEQGKLGAAQIGAGSRESVAQTQAQTQQNIHRFIPVPNVGLFDSQTRQVIPETEQGITITPEIAKDHNLPDQFIGKPMSLQQLAAVQRSDVFQNTPMMTAEGPVVVNRKTSQATPVQGPGGQQYSPPALASPREIGDVNNPGQTVNVPAGQSFGQPGVQSASVQVARKAELSQVPTGAGNLKVAFNTALQHANLLDQALTAMDNGDVRTLNSIKNKFKTEFGSPDITNFATISQAYSDEVQKMLSGGHITEGEQKLVQGKLPSNASPQQIRGALQSYRTLAQSKLNMLNQQTQSAVQGARPKTPTAGNRVLVEGKDF